MPSHPVTPVLLEPLLVPKPWGGRRLETLLGKPLPAAVRIGESWELVSLPGCESRVRGGPLAGLELRQLVEAWGPSLLGSACLVHGRFPLLLKFLDAAEPLSVQVHPKPRIAGEGAAAERRAAKDEAWVVLHADPGARLYIGLRPGVSPRRLAAAAGTPRMVDLLCARPARAGDCFFLPSGTVHALGAGIVVAEVQTPSEATYRLYDWGRVDASGRPRELHVTEGLDNVRYDVLEEEIARPSAPGARGRGASAAGSLACGAFTVKPLRFPPGARTWPGRGRMHMWMVTEGHAVLAPAAGRAGFPPIEWRRGDTLLLPAALDDAVVEAADAVQVLDITCGPPDGVV